MNVIAFPHYWTQLVEQVFALSRQAQEHATAIGGITPLLYDVLFDEAANLNRDGRAGDIKPLRQIADRRIRRLGDDPHHKKLRLGHANVGCEQLDVPRHLVLQPRQDVDELSELTVRSVL